MNALRNEKLIELRGERSREEVAKELGISVSALTKYERGERIPRDQVKVQIARYYHSSVASIFFANTCHNS